MQRFFFLIKYFLTVIPVILCLFSSCILSSVALNKKLSFQQIILVVVPDSKSTSGILSAYEHTGKMNKLIMSFPVVTGKNGLGWGRGLYGDSYRDINMPFKKEGDGKSPSGAFRLITAYGYESPDSLGLKFPYIQSTPDDICCDDTRSPLYNSIVNVSDVKLDKNDLPSHEKMLRDDNCYKYAVFVGHNTDKPVKGAGSCIFLHVWMGKDIPTSGCTAMDEYNMLKLLKWLDKDKNPVLYQLTEYDYKRLKNKWNLP